MVRIKFFLYLTSHAKKSRVLVALLLPIILTIRIALSRVLKKGIEKPSPLFLRVKKTVRVRTPLFLFFLKKGLMPKQTSSLPKNSLKTNSDPFTSLKTNSGPFRSLQMIVRSPFIHDQDMIKTSESKNLIL